MLGAKALSVLHVFRMGGDPIKTIDLNLFVPTLLMLFYLQRRALAGLPLFVASDSWFPVTKQSIGVLTSWCFDLLSQLSLENPFPVALVGESGLDQPAG